MVIHYGIGPDQVACGRNNHKVVSRPTPSGVTCKTCLSTEAHRAAAAASCAAPAKAGTSDNTPALKVIAFEEWRCRLSKGDRLPRGRYFMGRLAGMSRERTLNGKRIR